jgi:hypothetical protein
MRSTTTYSESVTLGEFMKAFLALFLCIALPVTLFGADAQNGFKVKYDGGSLGDMKVGTELRLVINSSTVTLMNGQTAVSTLPASSITEVSYGQDVHRRIGAAIGLAIVSLGIGALMALTKSKKHFVGLTWVDGDKKGGLAIQCDKNDYRGVLLALEGVTGKKAVDSDAMTVKN